MKFLKWFAIIFLVLLLLSAVGIFIFLKTFDINRYKPQIIAAAQSALNRQVDFGDLTLHVSLKEGIRASAKDIRLAEHASFGEGDFLTVKEVFVGVDLLAYLLRKEVSLAKVQVESPHVVLIREKDGTINAQTLAATASAGPNASTSQAAALPAIFIGTLQVNDGSLEYIDRTSEDDVKTEIKHIDLAINGFSLLNAFSYSLKAAVFNEAQNFTVNGRAKLDLAHQAVNVSALQGTIDLGLLDLDQLKKFPLPEGTPFPALLQGQAKIDVQELTVDATGVKSILLNAGVVGGAIKIDRLAEGVSLDLPHLDLTIDGLTLGQEAFEFNLSAALFHPETNIFLDGSATLDLKQSSVQLKDTNLSVDLATLSLAQLRKDLPLLKDVPLPETMAGKFIFTLNDAAITSAGLDEFNVDVSLKSGAVNMPGIAPGVDIKADQIDLTVKDLSTTAPGEFTLKAAYLNTTPNINANGKVALDPAASSVSLSDTSLTLDLASFSLEQLRLNVASMKDVPLPDVLKGLLLVKAKQVVVSPKGLETLLADIKLSDGQAAFKAITPGVALDVTQINANVKKFSLDDTFDWDLKAAYLSNAPNVNASGRGQFNMEDKTIELSDVSLTSDLQQLSLDGLRTSIEAMKSATLPESMKGHFSTTIEQIKAGPAGLMFIKGTATLSDGTVKLKELAVPFENIASHLSMSGSMITLQDFLVSIGQGTLKASGTLDDFLGAQRYKMKVDLQDIAIQELIDQSKSQIKAQGSVLGSLMFNGEGFDPATMFDALNGDGQFELKDGKLIDINILQLVLDKITFIPNLRQTIEENLPPRYKEKLQQKDTIITSMSSSISISDGEVSMSPIDLEADGFLFKGNGQAGFDQSYAFEGSFIIPADLAESMVKASPDMELLLDDEAQIQFPLKVSGKGSQVKFMPDIKSVGNNIIRNKGKQELQKVLDKVFDAPEQKTTTPQQTPPAADGSTAPATTTDERSPQQILIEGVLDKIFK